MTINPTMISWDNPTTREDGVPYTQDENAGYELAIDTQSSISIPVSWGTQFDISTLDSYKALKTGEHSISLRVVDKTGIKSDWSNVVEFNIVSKPKAPSGLKV